MGRPFYPHEVEDPDLDWLVSNFLYERPGYIPIETGFLPLVLLPYEEKAVKQIENTPEPTKEEKDFTRS